METISAPFRIVHLSDLHLTKADKDPRTDLKVFKPLKGMNMAFRKILGSKLILNADLILVTGDVTDRGDFEAWQVFWNAVNGAGLTERILVVPGNHDVCCLGARIPSTTNAYRRSDLQKAIVGLSIGNQPVKYPWVRIPDPRVAIFGMNSNNLGNLSIATNAMGKIGHYQLVSLASKLHKYRHVPVKIIALHHSPNIPGVDTARRRGQKEFSRLERLGHQIPQNQRQGLLLLCISHRVRLLLHGHLHMAEDRRVAGVRIIGSASSTEPISKEGSLNYEFYTYTVLGNGNRVRAKLYYMPIN